MLFKTRFPDIHVYGSIHFWDDSAVRLTEAAAQAYQAAERVVFEIDSRVSFDPKIGRLPDGKRLSDTIPPTLVADVTAAAKRFGISADSLEGLKPWAAAMHLIPHVYKLAGAATIGGIDALFFNQALTDGKHILSFETLSGQMEFFDAAPAAEQETFLRRTVSLKGVEEASKIFRAYQQGDLQTMEALSAEAIGLMPQLFSTLIPERNLSWRRRILEEFNDGVPTFIVVGALHCVGDTAVQSF